MLFLWILLRVVVKVMLSGVGLVMVFFCCVVVDVLCGLDEEVDEGFDDGEFDDLVE